MNCDVAIEFDVIDRFTDNPGMVPVKWCGETSIRTFQTNGKMHGICQKHFDLIQDGTQVFVEGLEEQQ